MQGAEAAAGPSRRSQAKPREVGQDADHDEGHEGDVVVTLNRYQDDRRDEEGQSVETEWRCCDELQSLRAALYRAHTHKLKQF
jgi:hypothetical protein